MKTNEYPGAVKTSTGPKPPKPPTPRTSGTSYTKKKAAGAYTTGDNERVTFTRAGKTVRVGPNSTVSGHSDKKPSKLQILLNALKGRNGSGTGGVMGTRG